MVNFRQVTAPCQILRFLYRRVTRINHHIAMVQAIVGSIR